MKPSSEIDLGHRGGHSAEALEMEALIDEWVDVGVIVVMVLAACKVLSVCQYWHQNKFLSRNLPTANKRLLRGINAIEK